MKLTTHNRTKPILGQNRPQLRLQYALSAKNTINCRSLIAAPPPGLSCRWDPMRSRTPKRKNLPLTSCPENFRIPFIFSQSQWNYFCALSFTNIFRSACPAQIQSPNFKKYPNKTTNPVHIRYQLSAQTVLSAGHRVRA